jgi:hypothetical protein
MLTLDQQVSPHPAVVDTALDTGETVLLQQRLVQRMAGDTPRAQAT